MRIRVYDGDTFEVKRTHVCDKVSDIGKYFTKLLADKLGMEYDDIKDKAILSLKSTDSEFMEIDIISDSKQYLLDTVIDKLTKEGFYDARKDTVAFISDDDWKNMV